VNTMTNVSIQDAQERLPELVRGLEPGDEVVIVENEQPIARIVPALEQPRRLPRRPGTLRGTVLHMAPDFNAPLDDFKEYME
jgi:antitoxin (DNA-binding transcriptional repressor) of toxin-antitoxin stability system